jgi:hypothetical protein
MIARLNCVTDEATRRAKQGRQRPGWPLSLRDSGGVTPAGSGCDLFEAQPQAASCRHRIPNAENG